MRDEDGHGRAATDDRTYGPWNGRIDGNGRSDGRTRTDSDGRRTKRTDRRTRKDG